MKAQDRRRYRVQGEVSQEQRTAGQGWSWSRLSAPTWLHSQLFRTSARYTRSGSHSCHPAGLRGHPLQVTTEAAGSPERGDTRASL